MVGAALLCGLCCFVPIAGVGIGMGIVTVVGSYVPVILMIIFGSAFMLFLYLRQKSSQSCGIDCACNKNQEHQGSLSSRSGSCFAEKGDESNI